MTNFLSSSANTELNHYFMSPNLTEWLLQEIIFYSVAITSQKGHNPHARADATLSTASNQTLFFHHQIQRFTVSPIIFIQPASMSWHDAITLIYSL